MEGESSPVKSFETETRPPGGLLILLLMAALIDLGATSHNPHQPAKITWKLNDGQTHELLNETSGIHPPNTRWPDLNFDLSNLFAKQDGLYDKYYRDGIKNHRMGFWACPGYVRNNWKTCGGIESYYCRKKKKKEERACLLSHFSRVQLFATLWTIATRLLCPWDSPGKNTGVGCHAFSRGSSQPRDWTHGSYVSCTGRQVLYH